MFKSLRVLWLRWNRDILLVDFHAASIECSVCRVDGRHIDGDRWALRAARLHDKITEYERKIESLSQPT